MRRWGERGHTPRRVLHGGGQEWGDPGLVGPEWAVAWLCALLSLPATACQYPHQTQPKGGRDITQLPSRPRGRRGTPARAPTLDFSGRRADAAAWAGIAAPTLLPPCLGGTRPAPDPGTRQQPPRYNRATAVPHLLLGPGCRASIDPPGCQGQGGQQQQQQQQVAGAVDARVRAACHLSEDVRAPVPLAAGGHEPGYARPSLFLLSTLGIDYARPPSAPPLPPTALGRLPIALRRLKPQIPTHLPHPGP